MSPRALCALAVAAWLIPTLACAEVDITGAWSRYGPGPGQTVDPKLVPGRASDPELLPRYKAAYEARLKAEAEADERGTPLAGNSVHCLPDGVPGMMFAIYPLEILQNPGRVTIIEEAYSQVRRVWLNKPMPALDDIPPSYYGYSVGRWEGDTLVVETLGVKESVPILRGAPRRPQTRVTERLRLVAPDVLHNQITVEDPEIYAKPWTFTFAYRKMPGYEMLEYVCEDNREYVDEKGQTHLRLETPAGD